MGNRQLFAMRTHARAQGAEYGVGFGGVRRSCCLGWRMGAVGRESGAFDCPDAVGVLFHARAGAARACAATNASAAKGIATGSDKAKTVRIVLARRGRQLSALRPSSYAGSKRIGTGGRRNSRGVELHAVRSHAGSFRRWRRSPGTTLFSTRQPHIAEYTPREYACILPHVARERRWSYVKL